jgi:hypothetical protein
MPGDRIPHPTLPPAEIGTAPQVNSMGIRTSVATQFINAAKALENDNSKEKLQALINVGRIKLANAIMPNIPLTKF